MRLQTWLTSLLHMAPMVRVRRSATWRSLSTVGHSAWVETLEDRVMLSVSSSLIPEDPQSQLDETNTPVLFGDWQFNGRATRIGQDGLSLFFTNENGTRAEGCIIIPTEVVATEWGGLRGTIEDDGNTIRWDNGGVWQKAMVVEGAPDISGNWHFNGRTTRIEQDGSLLVFTNEDGNRAEGRFTSLTEVEATNGT